MLGMFKKKQAPAEEVVSEEEDSTSPRQSKTNGEYDLDVEADGDNPATAASVVAALYEKYKKNVRPTLKSPDTRS